MGESFLEFRLFLATSLSDLVSFFPVKCLFFPITDVMWQFREATLKQRRAVTIPYDQPNDRYTYLWYLARVFGTWYFILVITKM